MPNKKKYTVNKHYALWAGYAAVGLILLIFALELTGTTHLFHDSTNNNATTANTETKGNSNLNQGAGTNSENQSNQSQNDKTSYSNNGGASVDVMMPSGIFVSNHMPGVGGAPETIQSSCNTTPGANCQITFTKDGVTKALPVKTTNSNGYAHWADWRPNDINLTQGNWKIQAVATLGGHSKTASDSMDLVVSK